MQARTSTMSLGIIAFLVVGCAHTQHPGAAPGAAIDRWSSNYPDASRDLGVWVEQHKPAATYLFEWDGAHPDHSRDFVTWTIANPNAPIEVYVSRHPGLAGFDQFVETHRPATESFMAWCRRHPQAAEALISHPGALRWAGNHLYAASWKMESH